jgi:hypothetical protein
MQKAEMKLNKKKMTAPIVPPVKKGKIYDICIKSSRIKLYLF